MVLIKTGLMHMILCQPVIIVVESLLKTSTTMEKMVAYL